MGASSAELEEGIAARRARIERTIGQLREKGREAAVVGVVLVAAIGVVAGLAVAGLVVRRRRQPRPQKAEAAKAEARTEGVRWEKILIRAAQAAGTAAGAAIAKRLFARSTG